MLECLGRQCSVAPRAHAPADQPPGVPIHHGSHVAPLPVHAQVRHVAHPDLVRRHDLQAALLVGHAGEEGALTHLRASIKPCAAPLQAALAHEARDTATPYWHAQHAQSTRHSGAAVVATALRMHLAHVLAELGIAEGSRTGLAALPGVVAASRHAEQLAHHLDREALPVCLDEGEDFTFRSEANRIAFFRRSCSICSCLYLRSSSCSRFSSATCGASSAGALPVSTPSRTCLRHLDSMNG